jgi:hypothetical protein
LPLEATFEIAYIPQLSAMNRRFMDEAGSSRGELSAVPPN